MPLPGLNLQYKMLVFWGTAKTPHVDEVIVFQGNSGWGPKQLAGEIRGQWSKLCQNRAPLGSNDYRPT
eukprot:1577601-Amphidinium_carterae.2